MRFETETLYHIYNRGNNQQQVFFTPEHYLFFLRKVRQHIQPNGQLLAYCLMPSHFHLLLYTTAAGCQDRDTTSSTRQPLTQGIASMLSSYTQGINKQLERTGALFQPKTKARALTDPRGAYARNCFHYIHQNPVRAKLTLLLEGWPYSSYRDYAGFRSGTLCNQAVALVLLDLPAGCTGFRQEAELAIPAEFVAGWM
ncbi:transposase [Hymenobacter daeguensis]